MALTTVVTGASSGIGHSLARRLAVAGHPVALLARRRPLLDALAQEIQAAGGRALAVACDVTDAPRVREAFREIESSLGPVERLVANAGGGSRSRLDELNAAQVRDVVELNLLGTVHCVDAVLPGMRERGRGHLVAMSSLAGYRGLPGAAAYSAAKGALTNLMEALRIELRPEGVDVTVLLPGFVRVKPRKKRRRPFELDLEVATARMQRAIEARRPRDAFPLPLVLALSALRLAPAPLVDRLLSRVAL